MPKFCVPQVLCFIIYSDKVVMVMMPLEKESAMCLADYGEQLRWYINWQILNPWATALAIFCPFIYLFLVALVSLITESV